MSGPDPTAAGPQSSLLNPPLDAGGSPITTPSNTGRIAKEEKDAAAEEGNGDTSPPANKSTNPHPTTQPPPEFNSQMIIDGDVGNVGGGVEEGAPLPPPALDGSGSQSFQDSQNSLAVAPLGGGGGGGANIGALQHHSSPGNNGSIAARFGTITDDNAGRNNNEMDDSDDDQDVQPIPGQYDPSEFQSLPVTEEIRDLFAYIGAYVPKMIEMESNLKPFVLDYIPAVGDIDPFIKIPRPDDVVVVKHENYEVLQVEDNLGVVQLDEPCANQSDAVVLNLHLRAITKEEGASKETVAKELSRADRNPREIEQWIANISELHKSKPATVVQYKRPMPDIDTLMQEWPGKLEDGLKTIELPSGSEMDMSLEQYIDVICSVLDIPIHDGNRVHALHLLFTLYSEFKNSQHFKSLAGENQLDDAEGPTMDRLVL